MLKKLLLCVITLIGLAAKSQISTAYVVPNKDWIRYYSQADDNDNIPNTIDADNNTYLIGYTGQLPNTDLLVLKYDSLGTLVYAVPYNNGGYDAGMAIKVDALGNAYVVGVSDDASTGLDYVMLKISPLGTIIWTTRFDGGVNGIDVGRGICIDANGDVYVTGKSQDLSNSDMNIVTVKLDGSNGGVIWQHDFMGISGLDDEGTGLVLSSDGLHLYITGNTTDAINGTDIVTYALDAGSGTYDWSPLIINGPANGNDKSNAIILSGVNVVICGELDNTTAGGPAYGIDAVTIKIDGSLGSTIWQREYDFANATNNATSLVKDSTGNIGVTGIAYNPDNNEYEYHTNLYDSTGTNYSTNIERTNSTSFPVEPRIACDSIAHHWYVSGEKTEFTKNAFVYQLSPSGLTAWRQIIDGQTNNEDFATGLSVNGVGVVYVAAASKNTSNLYDLMSIKINQTPVYFPPDLGTPELPHDQFTFEENRGQLIRTDGGTVSETEVSFFCNATTPSHYFNKNSISFLLCNSSPALDGLPDSLHRVDMSFVGSNSFADLHRFTPKEFNHHYFVGSSPVGITDVKNYERLFVPNIYPYTDLHYYSNSRGLKSYFVFKQPFEALGIPRFEISGADSSAIVNDYLIAYTPLGNINMGKLTAYQPTINPITLSYTLLPITASWDKISTNLYGFSASGYNQFIPMTIYISRPGATSAVAAGPIDNIQWSTFIGGMGQEDMIGSAADTRDNYYTCGYTSAINFPYVPGSFLNAPPSNAAAVYFGTLSKFRPNRRLAFSTYFRPKTEVSNACGDTPDTKLFDVAIDSLFSVYAVGSTRSNQMPIQAVTLTGGLSQTSNAAGSTSPANCGNAIIFKLDSTGKYLRFGSYYGGMTNEYLKVAKYFDGNVWFGGRSESSNLTVVNSGGGILGTGHGFFMRVDTQGVVKHCTKTGTEINGGAVDKNGYWYICGSSGPVYGVTVQAPAAGFYTMAQQGFYIDGTLQRFTPGDALDWSTYIGGDRNDYLKNMTIRDSILVLCGYGTSTVYPFVKASSDSGDVVAVNSDEMLLVKFDITTGQRLWSAYHATTNREQAFDVALDPNYNLFVTGWVQCATNVTYPSCPGTDFKLTPGSGYYQQSNKIGWDGFMIGYNYRNERRWTTYLGSPVVSPTQGSGKDDEWGYAIEANNYGWLFTTGFTRAKSNSFPLARLNNVCHYDSAVADVNYAMADGFITMFGISNFSVVGIEENGSIEVTDNILLFPNPNNGIFTIRIKENPKTAISMRITNLLGQLVYNKTGEVVQEGDYEIDSGHLPNGIYFLTLTEGNKQRTIKFIVN